MMSSLYHSIFLLDFFLSLSLYLLLSVDHVCLGDKTLISTLYLHTISLAPWTFYSRWCRCLWSLTWLLSLSLFLSLNCHFSLLILSLSTSHPSSADNRNLYIFSSLPVSGFPLNPERCCNWTNCSSFLSPLNVPVLLPSLLSFSICSLRLSTRRPRNAIEINSRLSLSVHSIVLFTFSLSLWGERVSLTRKLLSFNLTQQTLTNTFSYMKYRQTQTPLLFLLYFFLSSFILSFLPSSLSRSPPSPVLCVLLYLPFRFACSVCKYCESVSVCMSSVRDDDDTHTRHTHDDTPLGSDKLKTTDLQAE